MINGTNKKQIYLKCALGMAFGKSSLTVIVYATTAAETNNNKIRKTNNRLALFDKLLQLIKGNNTGNMPNARTAFAT